MADSDNTQTSDSPGIGMRLAIASIAKKFSSVKNMTTESLASLMNKTFSESHTTSAEGKENKELLILDSRPDEEFVVSHVPGSVRVDYEADVESIIKAVPQIDSPETKTVVCYCSIGYRSCMVAEKLNKYFKTKESMQTGRVEVYNLEGSLFKWANEGRPMVDVNSKPTVYAHPYNAVFGKLLNSDLRKKLLDTNSNI